MAGRSPDIKIRSDRQVTGCPHGIPGRNEVVVDQGCEGSTLPQYRLICEGCHLKRFEFSGRYDLREGDGSWPNYES